jgi:cytochrome c oxidase subunit II
MLRRIYGAVAFAVFAGLITVLSGAAPAMAGLGQPTDGALGLQVAATPGMEQISSLYDMVNTIIIAIAVFVLILLIYVVFRFNERANPTPSRTTHNTFLEVAWTIIPILILVAISIPSFKLLYVQYSFPKPDVTIKATGSQWYWEHEYMDDKFTLATTMLRDEDILKAKLGDKAFKDKYPDSLAGAARNAVTHADAAPVWKERNELRQLSVDQEIAVPVDKVVHMLVTSTDVIHSWTIPSFGVKMQAVPGRTSAVWFKPTIKGIFRGQCSVLCGKFHSGMPIVIRVVAQDTYDNWKAALKAKDKKKANEILKADASAGETKSLAAAQ